jgi:hypothetical protein
MSNAYKKEFDRIITADEFKLWIDRNSLHFINNLKSLHGDASLRWWIETFLAWSEYEDNK